jgi:tetratricopeptide (TPR) repeat protein
VKKETIIVGVLCLAVGFLAGYIYQAQTSFREAQRRAAGVPAVAEEAASSAAGGQMAPRLPEGHPPIDASAVIKTLEEQAAQDPKDPAPRLKLANYLYDLQQWPRAAEWYEKALKLDPRNVDARTDLGTTYFHLGRAQDALREYRTALAINPTHQPAMFNSIVVNLEGMHNVAAAEQAWDRLHKLNPSYPGLDSLKSRLDAARASNPPARP